MNIAGKLEQIDSVWISSWFKQHFQMFLPKARQYFSRIFSAVLLLSCSIFVLFKGYECFKKYLDEPEGSRVQYVFAGSLPFPAITFCPVDITGFLPKSYNEKAMKSCNLSVGEYTGTGPWIGTGGPNCTGMKI